MPECSSPSRAGPLTSVVYVNENGVYGMKKEKTHLLLCEGGMFSPKASWLGLLEQPLPGYRIVGFWPEVPLA